jgi:hypothetical protein
MTEPKIHRLVARWTVWIFTAVLCSVTALEGILQLAAGMSLQAAGMLDQHAGLLLADERLIHRPNPAFPEHDSWGFRNDRVPDRAFAVALGDSQTYGAMASPDQAWPQQLSQVTGEPIYNMAFGGYGAAEASLLLDKALELKPEWVLYGLYTGNDLYDAYEFVYKIDTLERLRSTDGEILSAFDAAEAAGTIEEGFKKTNSTGASFKQWFGGKSKLYGLARALRNVARGSAWQEEETPWSAVVNASAANPDWILVEHGTSPTAFTPQFWLLALDRDDPRILEGERITFALLSEMAERCSEAGVNFAVVALPTKELVYKEATLASNAIVNATLEQLWRDEAAFWKNVKNFCSENGIAMIDTFAELRQSLNASERPFRQDSNGHMTPAGNGVVSHVVRARIKPADASKELSSLSPPPPLK